jgi:hypothetical protein
VVMGQCLDGNSSRFQVARITQAAYSTARGDWNRLHGDELGSRLGWDDARHMPTRAEQYRTRAEECLVVALYAHEPDVRRDLRALAAHWRQLAEQVDLLEALNLNVLAGPPARP